ncbi:MAG: GNAT family N-acetyltransferase [Saprospiraceae bacterium]|nr:GNAT family N-acetyltransferase [Saprospiraceae bacterium]
MTLNFDIILEDKRVRLEPLSWAHFETLLPIAIQHPDLLDYSPPPFGSEDTLKLYFQNNLELKNNRLKCPFVIFDKNENCYAGSSSFLNISEIDERLEIGSTWLGKKFQRTGLNRHCKYLMFKYAFETLKFQRVELKTDARNTQSRTAIKAIGAQYEGTLRSHTLLSDGHRRDTVYYSILKDEWPGIRTTVFKSILND